MNPLPGMLGPAVADLECHQCEPRAHRRTPEQRSATTACKKLDGNPNYVPAACEGNVASSTIGAPAVTLTNRLATPG